MAKNFKFDLRFLDECHFQQHGSRCRMWVPPEEKDPILLHAPTKKSISLFGSVTASTGEMMSQESKIFNAKTFFKFLKKILRTKKKGRKIVIVLDNATYHHATILKAWLKENRKKIMLLFLPSYSPELNHIERVWKITRKLCTHNEYFPTLEKLMVQIQKQMKRWRNPNETLQRLCCII